MGGSGNSGRTGAAQLRIRERICVNDSQGRGGRSVHGFADVVADSVVVSPFFLGFDGLAARPEDLRYGPSPVLDVSVGEGEIAAVVVRARICRIRPIA